MNRIFIVILFLLSCGVTMGQIATTDRFISIGDTVHIIKTQLNSIPGERSSRDYQTWNFLFLDAPFVEEVLFLPAGQGMDAELAAEAEMVAMRTNGEEVYWKKSGESLIEIGRHQIIEELGGDMYTIIYDTKPIVQKKSRELNDRFRDKSSYSLDIPLSKAHDLGIQVLPIRSDFIRIQFDIQKQVRFDAEGDLLLPFGNYQVVRSKDLYIIDSKITIPSDMGFQDLSPSLYSVVNPEIIIGRQELTHYHYWTDTHTRPVLSIMEKSNGNYDVEYINEEVVEKLPTLTRQSKEIMAYPNPTFGNVTFQLTNYPAGEYHLQIADIVNKPRYNKKYTVRSNGKIEADLSFLPKGTYLYNIIDSDGRKLVTKRIVILRP